MYRLALFGFITLAAFTNAQSLAENRQLQPHLRESLPLISADRVWTELGITGKGVSIVVIDDVSTANNGPHCQYLHGMPVSEIIHAVAPDAQVLTFDVIAEWDDDEEGCVFTNIDEGLRWALQVAAEQNVRAVNLSLGGDTVTAPCTNSGEDEIRALYNAGMVVVAAAGNEGLASAISNPACLPEVISVGATYDATGQLIETNVCSEVSQTDHVTCYSNRAYFLDLVAPGTVVSTPYDPDFGGTSAAAPIVAGVVALMLSANPALTPEQVRAILKETGDPAYDPKDDRYFPRVNAYRAVQRTLRWAQPPEAPEQAFDTNGNKYIDDAEIISALDSWARQELPDAVIVQLLDLWATHASLGR